MSRHHVDHRNLELPIRKRMKIYRLILLHLSDGHICEERINVLYN